VVFSLNPIQDSNLVCPACFANMVSLRLAVQRGPTHTCWAAPDAAHTSAPHDQARMVAFVGQRCARPHSHESRRASRFHRTKGERKKRLSTFDSDA
jgi:hypothetical protein